MTFNFLILIVWNSENIRIIARIIITDHIHSHASECMLFQFNLLLFLDFDSIYSEKLLFRLILLSNFKNSLFIVGTFATLKSCFWWNMQRFMFRSHGI